MAGDEPQSHDPELKAAVILAHGGHTASADLRAKVMLRMDAVRAELDQPAVDAERSNVHSLKMPSQVRPWYLMRAFFVAAAAILLLAIGGTSYWNHYQHELDEQREYLENNRPLLLAMIAAFDGKCDTDPDRKVIDTPTDARDVAKELTKRLGRDVPAVNMRGWTTESVSICQVGTAKAAHWQLSKNGQKMAVLSLPKEAFNIEEYEDYDFKLNGHEIAGFLRQGSINCVVCDPTVGNREALRLRDELKRG